MKEEPTPYHGADSLKQIPVLFYFSSNLPDFNLQNRHGAHVIFGTPLFACSRPQDFLRHFRGCQLPAFVPIAVAALPFANVVKVSDNPHLSIEKS